MFLGSEEWPRNRTPNKFPQHRLAPNLFVWHEHEQNNRRNKLWIQTFLPHLSASPVLPLQLLSLNKTAGQHALGNPTDSEDPKRLLGKCHASGDWSSKECPSETTSYWGNMGTVYWKYDLCLLSLWLCKPIIANSQSDFDSQCRQI